MHTHADFIAALKRFASKASVHSKMSKVAMSDVLMVLEVFDTLSDALSIFFTSLVAASGQHGRREEVDMFCLLRTVRGLAIALINVGP